ncbi:MAG: TatD family hydrolase [Flammeovirgaceae bacterium]
MTKFHDTHVHLDILLAFLKVIPEIREEIEEEGFLSILSHQKQVEIVAKIDELLVNHDFVIQSTISYTNYDFVQKLLGKNSKIKYLLGSHPELVSQKFDLQKYLRGQAEFVKNELPKSFDLIGIGESGLDYHYTQNPELISTQKELFVSDIGLALSLNLPLVIHCRDAFGDLIDILKNFPKIHGNFLVHCYTGDKETLKQILDLGGKAAFGGIISFGKSADTIREALKYCPADSFVLETDLPFLTPTPHRGQTNLPEFIQLVAQKAAEIRGVSTATIWEQSLENVRGLFGNF